VATQFFFFFFFCTNPGCRFPLFFQSAFFLVPVITLDVVFPPQLCILSMRDYPPLVGCRTYWRSFLTIHRQATSTESSFFWVCEPGASFKCPSSSSTSSSLHLFCSLESFPIPLNLPPSFIGCAPFLLHLVSTIVIIPLESFLTRPFFPMLHFPSYGSETVSYAYRRRVFPYFFSSIL